MSKLFSNKRSSGFIELTQVSQDGQIIGKVCVNKTHISNFLTMTDGTLKVRISQGRYLKVTEKYETLFNFVHGCKLK